MSEITAKVALQVLELALAHCPEGLAELLDLARVARDAQDDMSRAQSCGPDARPAVAESALATLDEALAGLSLDVEMYALEVDAKNAEPLGVFTIPGSAQRAASQRRKEASL